MVSEREITDFDFIENLLDEAEVCRVALFDGEFPHIVPTCFGFCLSGGILELYFRCDEQGHNAGVLKKTDKAAFEIGRNFSVFTNDENACLFDTSYESVSGAGSLEFITGIDKIKGLNLIIRKYDKSGREFNIPEQVLNSFAVFKLTAAEFCCKKHGADAEEAETAEV